MLFAEIGDKPENDLFLRVEYDGAIATNGATLAAEARQDFGVLSGTNRSAELMETYLSKEHDSTATKARALKTALQAWSVGNLALGEDGAQELPAKDAIAAEVQKQLRASAVEAADSKTALRYRALTVDEIEVATAG